MSKRINSDYDCSTLRNRLNRKTVSFFKNLENIIELRGKYNMALDFTELGVPRSEVIALINEWILNERDRKIMIRRHADGVKYEDLADEFDMSVRGIKKVVCINNAILVKHIICTKDVHIDHRTPNGLAA